MRENERCCTALYLNRLAKTKTVKSKHRFSFSVNKHTGGTLTETVFVFVSLYRTLGLGLLWLLLIADDDRHKSTKSLKGQGLLSHSVRSRLRQHVRSVIVLNQAL